MSARELMQRLAAPASHPRLYLIRFDGVPAPHAKRLAAVVPGTAENPGKQACQHEWRSARMIWARGLMSVFEIAVEHCRHRGGGLEIIAAIEEAAVIARILGWPWLTTSRRA